MKIINKVQRCINLDFDKLCKEYYKHIPLQKINSILESKGLSILDEENNYEENNLLYTQIKCVLLKNNSISNNKIILYKNTSDDEHNIYWRIIQDQNIDLTLSKKIDSPVENLENFYLETINDDLCYICESSIHKIIQKNIFELYYKPGIVIDPIDKINLIM